MQTEKQRIGAEGERLAQKYLRRHLYKIIETNFRSKLGEIDIIARRGKTLVFVEVKARSTDRFGTGAEAIDIYKRRKMSLCARGYLHMLGKDDAAARFDVIEINAGKINHIKNAFECF